MKKSIWVFAVIGWLLAITSPAAASTGRVSIDTAFGCKDITRVSVSGSSNYATNRVKVSVYLRNSKGEYKIHREAVGSNFGSGNFALGVIVDYSEQTIASGAEIRVDVQLQRQNGGSFADVGAVASTYLRVADQNCRGKCAVTISSSDKAPAKGILTLRTHFGAWFRPEGRLVGAIPINAGARLDYTAIGVSCGAAVRVWYYPATGKDRTPKLLPAQYWPNEYAATNLVDASSYATTFARGVAATKPLESDDPYAPK